jgi:acyl CoA:acetate/3-ketoacid CoA transferase alpha subunit
MISSYVGENKEFERQYLAGELELEFTPRARWPRRCAPAAPAFPAFFTKTGVGTLVAEGKELREFDGETYVMERAIVADVSLVKAWRADKSGNLQFRLTARNFNPAAATCGKVCMVEVEELVEVGEIAPTTSICPASMCTASCTTPIPKSASKSAPCAKPETWWIRPFARALPPDAGRPRTGVPCPGCARAGATGPRTLAGVPGRGP